MDLEVVSTNYQLGKSFEFDISELYTLKDSLEYSLENRYHKVPDVVRLVNLYQMVTYFIDSLDEESDVLCIAGLAYERSVYCEAKADAQEKR